MTVVDGGVEHIDPGFEAGFDRSRVGLVRGIAGLAQVRSQSNGRKPKLVHTWDMFSLTKVAGVAQIGEAIAVAAGAGGSGVSGKHGKLV